MSAAVNHGTISVDLSVDFLFSPHSAGSAENFSHRILLAANKKKFTS